MKCDVFYEIVECQEVLEAKKNDTHPCHKIVTSQTGKYFQIPEPWNGNIETAEILFISSNPSYDENEVYPNSEWSKAEKEEFFNDRLKSTPRKEWSKYWKTIYKWAGWILPDSKDLTDKIALTEVVHCKSKKQKGVTRKCMERCTDQWLKKVLSLFRGKYLVIVGKVAQGYTDKIKELTTAEIIIETPHPSARIRGLSDAVRRECFGV